MSVTLFLMSFIAACIGAVILQVAKSAIHEIQAGICFLIAAALFGSSAIVYAIDHLRHVLTETNLVAEKKGMIAPSPEHRSDAPPRTLPEPMSRSVLAFLVLFGVLCVGFAWFFAFYR